MNRIDNLGANINKNKKVNFYFNGKKYSGFEGDNIASALLANNIHFIGRSLKTHRPRGIMASDASEPNAVFTINRGQENSLPNIIGTQMPIYEGLKVNSVNIWPSLNFDLGSINQYFSSLLVAGFYYKTFMWPQKFWKLIYEPIIRKFAGLGVCDLNLDQKKYSRIDHHCQILIIGAGKTGIEAAIKNAKEGREVTLVEEKPKINKDLAAKIAQYKNIKILTKTSLFGYYDHNYLCANEYRKNGQRIWHFHAQKVILAVGAHERPFIFKNNDLPGIMLSSAVKSYLLDYGVKCGNEIVIFSATNYGYEVAKTLIDNNIKVKAIIDPRASGPEFKLDVPIYQNAVISQAKGKKHLKSVVVSNYQTGEKITEINCDLLAVSAGFNPNVNLFSQSGGKLEFCDERSCFVPLSANQNLEAIGACNGDFAFEEKGNLPAIWDISSNLAKDNKKTHIVDFADDVSAADIELAVREGMNSVELVKRYTTAGMGIDQGKISNVNTIGIQANAAQKTIPQVGTTKFRPPYSPVTFGSLAGMELGNLLDPVRTTTIHDWHVKNGALFEDVGQWKRPWYFPKKGESMQDSLNRESLAVRKSVGMLDASTLGKIDIQGKDAGKFLDLIYTNMFSTLKVGACRYGVMCHEDGMVFDDGVTACIGENHYYMTTTTGGAAGVLDWMEFWLQTQYPELEVFLTSVTEQYGAIVVTGPNCRKVLQKVIPDHYFSSEAFPFMAVQNSQIAGVDVKLIRISFTGELSFEVHCPAFSALEIWEKIYEAGKEYDITPYGTENMHILRAEKGFIIVGQDTDGTVTPLDLGMSWVVSKKKDFIGKRSLTRSDTAREDRKQMVGIINKENPEEIIPEGAQIVEKPSNKFPVKMEGYVSSSYYSAILGHSFALALINGGLNRHGEELYASYDGKFIKVEVTSPIFYDPKGERQNVI